MSAASTTTSTRRFSPELIIAAGCAIAMLTFGPRSSIGIFQLPILKDFGFGTDTFSFALAIQYLLWGMGQPFAGALADRFGMRIVLIGGTLFYALGLVLMAWSSSPLAFNLSAGVILGFGLSGASFNLVISAFSKLLPERWRPIAFGLGTAAGSFGQFLFAPLTGGLVGSFGWQTTTIIFGVLVLAVIPLSIPLASPPQAANTSGVRQQTIGEALREAFGHRSYVLLVTGFFTCGFQLAFITVHFQKYVVEAGLDASVGYWAFALVGAFNIVGSLTSGWASTRVPRRWVLSLIYISRALATLAFILMPPTAFSAYAFGIITGLLWLSTVPPTSALIGLMFGNRYFATLYGFAFFSHQLGGFFGLTLSGILRERTGSYDILWWLSIALGVFSALVNLPIIEKPVVRAAVPATA